MRWVEKDEEIEDDNLTSHTRTETEREREREKYREGEREGERGRKQWYGRVGVTLGRQNSVT